MQRQFHLSHLLALLFLLLVLSACGEAIQVKTSSITITPATTFSREQAIQRARESAPLSAPEVGMQQVRIDSITAELMALGDADRRMGAERGPAGYGPGQTAQSLVWWVTVNGYFKYEGMSVPGAVEQLLHEADERIFVYDAKTGSEIGSRIGPDRPVSLPATPTPEASPSMVSPATQTPPVVPAAIASLTVEENPIVGRGVDTPDHMEYNQRIPADVRNRHVRDRNLPPDKRVEATNKVLAKYGYRLQHDPPRSSYVYLLYRDNQLLLDEIIGFRPVNENAAGNDFLLYVYSDKNGDRVVRKDSLQEWKHENVSTTPPILFGKDLIYALWQDTGAPPYGEVVAKQGDRQIFSIAAQFMVADPIKGLWAWNDHWVLEVDGKLIVDGENQNEKFGYDEIFEWHLIHGQPFYFFKKGGSIGISYAGQELANRYEQVIHYACCEPAIFNPGYTEDMIWFHALRNDMWYYVEAGVYQ